MAHSLQNIISPFSRVIKWKYPKHRGFYIFPHNDDFPDGWGKPYQTPDGEPVPEPVTPVASGGYDPLRKINWNTTDEAWELQKNPGDWLYGNIDWRGPVVNVAKEPFRLKLSYHGPQARYFASTSFSYGSEQKHNEIYCRGLYAGIAPYPVLGAAYTTFFDEDLEEDVEYLVVICKYYLTDRVYIKPRPALVAPSAMTEELRAEMMRLYDYYSNQDGWRNIATVEKQIYAGETALEANTPWFFSEDGKKAQCMRTTQKTFDNGMYTTSESGLFRYQLSLGDPNTGSFTNQRNAAGYSYICEANKTSSPHIDAAIYLEQDMVPPSCNKCPNSGTIGNPPQSTIHHFSIDQIDMTMDCTGSYIVGVDYYGNDEILLRCKFDMDHQWQKLWRHCIDTIVADALGLNYSWNAAEDTGEDYFEDAKDGYRWGDWSWWYAGGDWNTSLDCEVCDKAGGDIGAYLAAGYPLPPSVVGDGRSLTRYARSQEIYLEWTHPTQGDVRKLYLYEHKQGLKDLLSGSTSIVEDEFIDGLSIYKSYPLYLDIRVPEGPFVVAKSETINRKSLGVQKTFFTPPNDMDLNNWYYNPIYDHQEFVRYEMIDPFDNPGKVKVLSIEQGEVYQVDDGSETCDRDEMVSWAPAGSVSSINEPQAVQSVSEYRTGPPNDWRRNDFSWTLETISVQGYYPTEADYDGQNLEPCPDDWNGDARGDTDWPTWGQLLLSPKNVTEGGFEYQDGIGVCVSIRATKGITATGGPLPKPVTAPSGFEKVYYLNYITKGVMDEQVPPADRFYPIGVE